MDPLRPAGAKPAPDTNSASGDGWRIGQRLAAVVVRGTAAGGGDALLRIGRLTLLVRSQLPLVQGDHLAIEVARLTPTVTLRLIGADSAAADAHATQAQAALRTLLPRQSGLPQLFAVLTAARARTAQAPDSAPLRQAIDKLLGNLLQSGQVGDAGALRRAVLDAGPLFDARTAAGERPQSDLKGLLLQLLQSAAQASPRTGSNVDAPPQAQAPPPPRDGALSAQPRVPPHGDGRPPGAETLATSIRHLADGALARTALHQLSSADGSRAGAFLLHGELPIRDRDGVDVVHFRIRREARRTRRRGGAHTWTVSLALDLPGLGPLHARVGIQGRSVATRFWAEREATRRSIEKELPSLASALNRCGLETTALSCHAGAPPVEAATPAASDSALLDTRA